MCEPSGCSFKCGTRTPWQEDVVPILLPVKPRTSESSLTLPPPPLPWKLSSHTLSTRRACGSIVRSRRRRFFWSLVVFSFFLQDAPSRPVPICNRLPEPREVKITVIIIRKFPPGATVDVIRTVKRQKDDNTRVQDRRAIYRPCSLV